MNDFKNQLYFKTLLVSSLPFSLPGRDASAAAFANTPALGYNRFQVQCVLFWRFAV